MRKLLTVILSLVLFYSLTPLLGGGGLISKAAPKPFLATVAPFQQYIKRQAHCERGGQRVNTTGATSTTTVQQSIPSCTVTVYLTGTTTLATIYSDSNGSTPQSNPFTSDSQGYYTYYAASGTRVDERLSGGTSPNNIATPFTRTDILIGGSLTWQNQGTDVTPIRPKANLQLPFLRAADGGNTTNATNVNSARTPTGVYNAITDLNMSGDARRYRITANINSGATSATLTGVTVEQSDGGDTATASIQALRYYANTTNTWRVGQGIRIPRCGTSNTDHIATITAVSGNTITWTPATVYAGNADFIQHDETAAFQTWLNTYVKGTLYFPAGTYAFSSYYNYSSTKDYAIEIPQNSEATNQQWKFIGEAGWLSMLNHTGPGHFMKLKGNTTTNLIIEDLAMVHAAWYSPSDLSYDDAGALLYLSSDKFITSLGVPVTQSGATFVKLSRNLFLGGLYGVLSDNVQSSTFDKNWFYYCANPISFIGTTNQRGLGATTEPNANSALETNIQYSPGLSGARRSSATGSTTSASRTITCTGCSFTSADKYRIVKIQGAGVNGVAHISIITAVNSSTSVDLSQPPYTSGSGLTVEIYPKSLANIYLQNANGIQIAGGTFQGNRSNYDGEVYGILAEYCDQISIKSIWMEDQGGTGADVPSAPRTAAARFNNCNSVSISQSLLSSSIPVGGITLKGYAAALILDGTKGVDVTSSYISLNGASTAFHQYNGSCGLKIESSSLFNTQRLYNESSDSTDGANCPAEIGASNRFVGGSVKDDYNLANEHMFDDQVNSVLTNSNFADGLTGWTQVTGSALTVSGTSSSTDRYARYITVNAVSGSASACCSVMFYKDFTIPDTYPSGQHLSLAFDWQIQSRGTDPSQADILLNSAREGVLRVKLRRTSPTETDSNPQYEITTNSFYGLAAGRWIRSQVVRMIPAGTGRTFRVEVEGITGIDAPIVRLANFKLSYGRRPGNSHDEPIKSLAGGRINTAASVVLVDKIGGGNQAVYVNNSGQLSTVAGGAMGTNTQTIAAADYGVVCDDSTDDTANLATAKAAANSAKKKLLLPAGVCRITQLDIVTDDYIIGAGIDKTILKGTANNPIVTVSTTATRAKLESFTVQGNVALASQIGISLGGTDDYSDFALRDISIKDTGSHGLYVSQRPFSVDFYNVHTSNTVGYQVLVAAPYAPGIVFRNLYMHTINSSSPKVGIRVMSGRMVCDNCNGLDNAPPIAGTRWAVIGSRNGVDGATEDTPAFVYWKKTNFENFESIAVDHQFNSQSSFEDCSFGYGGSNANRIALKYDIDTASVFTYAAYHRKGTIDDQTIFGQPESDYKNGSYIHATGVPPLLTTGQGAQYNVANDPLNFYYDTTQSQRVPLMRADGFGQPVTVTGTSTLSRPTYSTIFTNCAAPCTITIPWPGWYRTNRELVIRDISGAASTNPVTINVDASATIDGAASTTISINNGTLRLIARNTGTDWKVLTSGGGGGTVTSVTASSPLGSSGGSTPNISLTGTIGVANGGTGNTSLTANGVLYGMGSSPLGATSAGGTGTVLVGVSGSPPAFSTSPTLSNIILTNTSSQITLGTGNTMTLTMAALTNARTFTLPDANSNPVIPDTGAANNFLTGISSGGVITKAQPSAANLSNGVTGAGSVVLNNSPTLLAPNIATFSAANHDHQSSSGGGTLNTAALTNGTLGRDRGGTGTSTATTDGQLLIGNTSTGNWSVATITAGANVTVTNGPGTITISASSSAGSRWDQLSNPTGNLSLSMGSFLTSMQWGSATGSGQNMLSLFDTASNTGTGYVFSVNTASSSAAKPVRITAGGTSNGVEMSTAGVLAPLGSGGITANALNGIASNGVVVQTSTGNFTVRTLTTASGPTYGGGSTPIVITNGSGVSGNPVIEVDHDYAHPWHAAHTWTTTGSGANGSTRITLNRDVRSTNGTSDSPKIVLRAETYDGSTHSNITQLYTDATNNDGSNGLFTIDNASTTKLTFNLDNAETNLVSAGSTVLTITSTGIVDSAVGFRIAGGATSGNYLRGNGSSFVSSSIGSADLPTVPVTKGGTGLTAGTSGGIPYFSSTTTIASSGALTANLPVFGGGAGAAPIVGTRTGNTTKVATADGSFVAPAAENIATFDTSGNLLDGLIARTDLPQLSAGNTFTNSSGQTFDISVAGTTTVQRALNIIHNNSTGAGASGIGSYIDWQLETTTTTSQPVVREQVAWVDATHASRRAKYSVLTAEVGGTTLQERFALITTASDTTDVLFGKGDASATTTATTLRGPAATGTDKTGASFTVDAANGTGTGGSGAIIFRTAPTASTSSTANTLTERMRITPSGNVGIGTNAPNGNLVVGTDLGSFGSVVNVVVGSASVPSYFAAGQAANRNINFGWQYNATAGSAYATLATFGYTNPFYLDASFIAIQAQSLGNVGLGTASFPSGGGAPVVALPQVSGNPTGVASNTAGLFVKDNGGTAELFAFDEAGNVQQLSPHPTDYLNVRQVDEEGGVPFALTGANIHAGSEILVDVVKLARALEKLTGEKYVYVKDLAPSEIQTWDAAEESRYQQRLKEIVAWTEEQLQPNLAGKRSRPADYVKQPEPDYIRLAREKRQEIKNQK